MYIFVIQTNKNINVMVHNYSKNALKLVKTKTNQWLTTGVKYLLAIVLFATAINSAQAQCSVSVSVNDNGDGTSTLYASGNGQGSISYNWDNGSTSSQITVTNDGAQHCVSVDDYYYDANIYIGDDAYGYPMYGDYTTDYSCSSDCGTVAAAATPPVAYFGADVTSGDAPLTVNFTDASTNSPTSYSWDFGDGNSSSAQNPQHIFTTPGTYNVTLTVTNADGTDTYSVTITVNTPPAPVASFTPDVTSGDAPLTVNFTDNSTNTPTSWAWDFGDGNSSSAQNPQHIFTTPGTYNVTLTVTNATGNDTYSITITVNAPPAPVANFTPDVTSGDAPLTVNFTDNSTNTPTSWAWDFGDGNSSSAQNPQHIFTTPGTYTVTLTASNANGNDTYSVTITVNAPPAPVASFTPDVTSGDAPLTVNFTDASTNTPTSWAWDFGDGNTSINQNPQHIFTTPGTYTVTLTATNATGSSAAYTVTITVNEVAPVAQFGADKYDGEAALLVNFEDQSLNNPTSWAWDFGDGNTSTNQNPSNIYANAGTYDVTLTATNGVGTSTSAISTITVTSATALPIAQFTEDAASGEAPLTVNFTDQSTENPTSWSWEVDGVVVSTDQHLVYTFDPAGTYNVTLTVDNGNGTNTSSATTITVNESSTAPVADFTADVYSGDSALTVQFTDASTNNPTSWFWDFGDGGTSTDQNPSYTFETVGTFTVTLTVDNGLGSTDTTATIEVLSPNADSTSIEADVYEGAVPLTVQFSDNSVNNAQSWSWDFGDGNTSNNHNDSHTYSDTGTFIVVLTSTLTNGSTQTAELTIVVTDSTEGKFSVYYDDGSAAPEEIFTDGKLKNKIKYNNLQSTNKSTKVCADGSQVTIIKYKLPANETLPASDFSVRVKSDASANNVREKGKFDILATEDDNRTIVARYTHPEYFAGTGKTITDEIEIVETNGTVKYTKGLEIYRPAVVMVHGLWSNDKAFKEMESALLSSGNYTQEQVYRVNYESSHADRFSSNFMKVSDGIKEVYKRLKQKDILGQKAALIGHSMGGILSRMYYSSEQYDNDMYSLITLNTPHSGSQYGNILHTSSNTCWALNKIGKNPYRGAIADLKVNSIAVGYLNSNVCPNLPKYSIASTDNKNAFRHDALILTMYSFPGQTRGHVRDSIFCTGYNPSNRQFTGVEESDMIVPLSSQLCGLSASQTYLGIEHTEIQKNGGVMTQVQSLLESDPKNSAYTSSSYDPTPLQSIYPNSPDLTGRLSNTNTSNNQNPNIKVNIKATATTLAPGNVITFDVKTFGAISNVIFYLSIEKDSLFGIYKAIDTTAKTFKTTFTIPTNYYGKIRVSCVASDSISYNSDSLLLFSGIDNLILDSLSIYPSKVFAFEGRTTEPSIKGYFKNVGEVDLTGFSGLSYKLGNNINATHLTNNLFRGKTKGETYLRVGLKGKTKQVAFEVIDSNLYKGAIGIKKITASNNSKLLAIKLYPNPTNNLCTLVYEAETTNEAVQITIYNMYGQLVKKTHTASTQLQQNTYVIDASGLTSGIYNVSVRCGNKLGHSKLSIIK